MAEDMKRAEGQEVADQDQTGPLPVVMLPGTLCDERVFAPLATLLPGHDLRILPVTDADSADALARLVLAAAPPRFVLAGFSLGGIVALQIAAIAPQRLGGLILIATNPNADRPENAATRRADVADARARGLAAFVRDRLWPRYVSAASRDDARLQGLILDMAEAVGIEAFARQTEVAISRAGSLPRLATLRVPVLALGGDEDVICPPDLPRSIARAAPDATLQLITSAGHFVPLEAPQALAAAMSAWLGQIPAHRNHMELP
jgi:pimeloyl-ACP methyl ester carboxylesterase